MLRILLFQWILILVSSKGIRNQKPTNLGKCVQDSANLLAPYLAKGIPEMNLPSVEPFNVPIISAHTDQSLIKIDMDVMGCKLFNLSNYFISNLDANLNNLTFSGKLGFQYIKANGNYKTKGTILTFTIESQGMLEFELKNVSADVEWYGATVSKNGNVHLKMNKIKFKLDVKEIKMYLHNLFGENQLLTDTVNGIINENIREVKKGPDELLEKTKFETFIAYFNNVLDLFTIDELFPDE